MASELHQAVNNPNQAIAIAVGPPVPPELVPQSPGEGLVLANRCEHNPSRFVLKKAHMSREDFRIFDVHGRIVAVLWHHGKNPYENIALLGTSNFVQSHESRMGEWESAANVTGYNGMASLKIRPKGVSRHGRQLVYGWDSALLFNIGKESKLKNLALRSNIAVRRGDGKDTLYRILPDLLGRTLQIVNDKGELVCYAQKTVQALITEAALGSGSEMVIDVAPGVDWTAMIAVIMALRQVGAHFVKDALSNFVFEPLKDNTVGAALTATGLQGVATKVGQTQDQAMYYVRRAQEIHRMFFT